MNQDRAAQKYFEKQTQRREKNFNKFKNLIENLQQNIAYRDNIEEILQQDIAGIGISKEKRQEAPRRGYNTKQNLTYFLTNHIQVNPEQITTCYDEILEAQLQLFEDYKHKVRGPLGIFGIGYDRGFEQIKRIKDAKLTQKKLQEPQTQTIYTNIDTKIYILTQKDLKRAEELLR